MSNAMGSYDQVAANSIDGVAPFAPIPLPKQLPLRDETIVLATEAERAVGKLTGSLISMQNPDLLQHAYISTEALASSRIEGTTTTLSEVLLAETQSPQFTMDYNAAEVLSNINALRHGIERLKDLPISLRLMREAHEVLMDQPRGAGKAPGEFRKIQNQIISRHGGKTRTVFVPPSVPQMETAMDELESFINTPNHMPALVSIALVHYQFETIHPFIDGNGRTGRILILLQMISQGLLSHPVLPISTFLEEYRSDYYECLGDVRHTGTYKEWINFFLGAVRHQATKTTSQIAALVNLRTDYINRLANSRSRARDLIDMAFTNPVLTAKRVSNELSVTPANAHQLLQRLESRGMLTLFDERPSRGRTKRYRAHEIFRIIEGD